MGDPAVIGPEIIVNQHAQGAAFNSRIAASRHRQPDSSLVEAIEYAGRLAVSRLA
jgi:hypothetical protein